MILQKLINSFNKTDDSMKNIKSLSKTDGFITKMKNSLSKTDDFIRNDKFI